MCHLSMPGHGQQAPPKFSNSNHSAMINYGHSPTRSLTNFAKNWLCGQMDNYRGKLQGRDCLLVPNLLSINETRTTCTSCTTSASSLTRKTKDLKIHRHNRENSHRKEFVSDEPDRGSRAPGPEKRGPQGTRRNRPAHHNSSASRARGERRRRNARRPHHSTTVSPRGERRSGSKRSRIGGRHGARHGHAGTGRQKAISSGALSYGMGSKWGWWRRATCPAQEQGGRSLVGSEGSAGVSVDWIGCCALRCGPRSLSRNPGHRV
jgi:hypothetical protein